MYMCCNRHLSALSRNFRNSALLALAFTAAAMILSAPPVQAQTFTVIHNFAGGRDGSHPYAGLTIDGSGSLYGTTDQGGIGTCGPENNGCGIVFKLNHAGSGWLLTPLYSFKGEPDGG